MFSSNTGNVRCSLYILITNLINVIVDNILFGNCHISRNWTCIRPVWRTHDLYGIFSEWTTCVYIHLFFFFSSTCCLFSLTLADTNFVLSCNSDEHYMFTVMNTTCLQWWTLHVYSDEHYMFTVELCIGNMFTSEQNTWDTGCIISKTPCRCYNKIP